MSQIRKEKAAAGLNPEDIWVTDADVGTSMQKALDKRVDRILLDQNIVEAQKCGITFNPTHPPQLFLT